MRIFLSLYLLILCANAFAQPGGHSFDHLRGGGAIPENILSSRSTVLYDPSLTKKEIDLVHENLVRTGIDPIVYYEFDRIFSGFDVRRAYLNYFTKREIANMIFVLRKQDTFKIFISPFTGTEAMIDTTKGAWSTSNKVLKECLNEVYRNALAGRVRQNLLLSEVPEKNLTVPVITGRRIEAVAYDLKVDVLAVPWFNDAKLDTTLKQIMKEHYPFKYGLVDASIPEADLRKQGYYYVLRYVNSRCVVAKELLGYDVSKGETAFVSATYPNGEVVTKNIPGNTEVYKFYPKKIFDSTIYLGTKWEADTTWEQALINFIKAFKAELRIN